MALFIASFHEDPPDGLFEKASQGFQRVYSLSGNTWIVQANADVTDTVSDFLGMGKDTSPRTIGMVFKLNGSYSGYHYESLWDWLVEARGHLNG